MWRFVFCLLFFPVVVAGQQKAMFSQYMFNGLIINPAYSAVDEALNITAVSRHQWVGFKGAPNTQTFSVQTPLKESNSSFGVILMRDQIGEVLTDNGVMASFAQRVALGEKTFLALGVDAGVSQYQESYSRISDFTSNTDPLFQDANAVRGNAGLGLMLFSDRFYAGISSPFMITTNGASSTVNKKHYILQGGFLAPLGEDLKFKPNALIKYVNGSPLQMDLNANFLLRETVWLGASWRSFDSVDFLAELQVGENMQLGYSYDFTTTKLARVEKGTHEIMLSFRFPVRGRSFPRCYF